MIAYQGFRTALAAPDTFGALLAAGITTWLCVQAFINIGVVVAVVPITGITLPFISAGGSSLIISFAAVGILLSISRETVERGTWNDAAADRSGRDGGTHLPRPGRRSIAPGSQPIRLRSTGSAVIAVSKPASSAPTGLPLQRLALRSLRTVDLSVNTVLDPARLALSVPQATALLVRRRPAAIFTTGGYVAIPMLVAAAPLRIPTILWEGNVIPGRSVRAVARLATAIAVSFAATLPNAGAALLRDGDADPRRPRRRSRRRPRPVRPRAGRPDGPGLRRVAGRPAVQRGRRRGTAAAGRTRARDPRCRRCGVRRRAWPTASGCPPACASATAPIRSCAMTCCRPSRQPTSSWDAPARPRWRRSPRSGCRWSWCRIRTPRATSGPTPGHSSRPAGPCSWRTRTSMPRRSWPPLRSSTTRNDVGAWRMPRARSAGPAPQRRSRSSCWPQHRAVRLPMLDAWSASRAVWRRGRGTRPAGAPGRPEGPAGRARRRRAGSAGARCAARRRRVTGRAPAFDALAIGSDIQRRLGVKTSRDEPLARFTTMRVGGPADLFAVAHNAFELRGLVKFARSRGLPHVSSGGGATS